MKGLMFLGSKIGAVFGGLFGVLAKFKGVLPQSFLGFFILITFFINWSAQGLPFAGTELAKGVLSAEYVIRENVILAISNSPEYGIFNLIEIFFSFMIIFYLVKWISKIVIFFLGDSTPKAGVYTIVLIGIFALEFFVVKFITGENFIPLYDGMFFLFSNIQPVIQNLHFFGNNIFEPLVSDVVPKNITVNNETLNQTINITEIISNHSK